MLAHVECLTLGLSLLSVVRPTDGAVAYVWT